MARWRARPASITPRSGPRASRRRPLQSLEGALAAAFDIRFAFNRYTLGEEFCTKALGFTAAQLDDVSFDMLAALGFTKADIEAANTYCCGAMTLEGAPHLKDEHICRSSTAPIPAGASASASSRWRAISA